MNAPLYGFDTDREQFLGTYNGFDRPDAVVEGRPRDSVADGWHPIGSHCVEVRLAPGERRELVYVLGYVENAIDAKWSAPGVVNKEPAHRICERIGTPEGAAAAFDALGEHWRTTLSRFSVHSAEPRPDRMVNIWNQYQCMVTYNLSRSASYFESGIGRAQGKPPGRNSPLSRRFGRHRALR